MPDQLFRVVLSGDARQTAAADILLLSPINASKRPAGSPGSNPTRLEATGFLYAGTETIVLTGSHDGRTTFTVSGPNWRLTGNIVGSSTSGTYTGPDSRQGTFAGEDAATGAATRYCGTFTGNRAGSWNLVVGSKGAVSGAFGGALTGTISGSVQGNVATINWRTTSGSGAGTATGNRAEGTLTGMWTGKVDNTPVIGNFSGASANCPGPQTSPSPGATEGGACACTSGQLGCLACGLCCGGGGGDGGAFVPVTAPPPRDGGVADRAGDRPPELRPEPAVELPPERPDAREVGPEPVREVGPEPVAEVAPEVAAEAPPEETAPPLPGGIRIVVVSETGAPVPNAAVELRRDGLAIAQATTDTTGSATFLDLAPGLYTVVVSVAGYNPGAATVTVPSGMTITVNARLERMGTIETAWTFIDDCPDNQGIDVRILDRTAMLLWPRAAPLRVESSQRASLGFTCQSGAEICYGGRSADAMTVYGVDADGQMTCTNCCTPCQSGAVEVKLVCGMYRIVGGAPPALKPPGRGTKGEVALPLWRR